MDGEKPVAEEVELELQRRHAAAWATQWVDWIMGGLKEAMGPNFPPSAQADGSEMTAPEPLEQEGDAA